MTAPPAAIMASLVDVRNVAAHKMLRLEIHVPPEQADKVFAAFGWPTAVNPVPVAIARMDMDKAAPTPLEPAKEPRKHTLSQQAWLLCEDWDFRAFLRSNNAVAHTHSGAAKVICDLLGIESRSEILPDTPAGRGFLELQRKFEEWRATPRAL